jgi:predicted dehydrogenase
MDEVRWGIVGCGNVTEKKSGPAFGKVPGSRLVAVMRRDAAKAEDYARRHEVPNWYSDAEALINDPEVNAVYVATPPDSHADYTLAAAAAGKPVYVEKPMARNTVECDTMLAACKNAGVPLYVAYYRRALPYFRQVKELIDTGAIGSVRCVRAELTHPAQRGDRESDKNWRVLPQVSGGGYFFDLASHQLDFLDYLLGPIEAVRGQVANHAGWYEAEDAVCASWRFAGGALGTGQWCFSARSGPRKDRIEVVGASGELVFSSFDFAPIRLETDYGIREFAIEPPEHVQQPLIKEVVDELLGRGTCPSTGDSAARTAKVMDRIMGR